MKTRNIPLIDLPIPLPRRDAISPDIKLKISGLILLLLLASSWSYVLWIHAGEFMDTFSARNLDNAYEFFGSLLGSQTDTPAYTDWTQWQQALTLSLQTLKMSVLAIGLAGLGMLLTVILGARKTADGTLSLKATLPGKLLFGVIRTSYMIARGVPELFWAMLIILVFNPGILPGALALAVHNYGILGKLCSEIVEDLDPRPIRSLRSSGAGLFQILFYGILPEVMPQFLTYLLYRWEEIIRTTIVVGFVSAGGLGKQFRLSMNWFHYTEVTLYLICYFLLVILVDIISGMMRSLAKSN
ncbi:MAG: PhnE/PtxC family ABC transporter permease [bacterium]